jgi:hypothetical protein
MKTLSIFLFGLFFSIMAIASENEKTNIVFCEDETKSITSFAWCGVDVRGTVTCPDGSEMYWLHGRVIFNCETGEVRSDLSSINMVPPSEACAGHQSLQHLSI